MHRTNIRGTFVVDQQTARRVRIGEAVINVSLCGRDITVNAVAP